MSETATIWGKPSSPTHLLRGLVNTCAPCEVSRGPSRSLAPGNSSLFREASGRPCLPLPVRFLQVSPWPDAPGVGGTWGPVGVGTKGQPTWSRRPAQGLWGTERVTARPASVQRRAGGQPAPPRRAYLQEGELVLDEGVHGQVGPDLVRQRGPVLAHGRTPVQGVPVQHTWKTRGGPGDLPAGLRQEEP